MIDEPTTPTGINQRLEASVLLLLSLSATANIAPPQRRPLIYSLTIDNLADYPDHVLLVYPTLSPDRAFVFEHKTELGQVMTRESPEGGSALYAMSRADFEAHAASPESLNYGDGVWLTAVPPPPATALKAELDIRPMEWVWEFQTERELVRTVHIDVLSTEAFVLQLVSEELLHDETGSQDHFGPVPVVPLESVPPKQTRCGTVASAGGLMALAMALIGLLWRRESAR